MTLTGVTKIRHAEQFCTALLTSFHHHQLFTNYILEYLIYLASVAGLQSKLYGYGKYYTKSTSTWCYSRSQMTSVLEAAINQSNVRMMLLLLRS
jgi:hypothetical protein